MKKIAYIILVVAAIVFIASRTSSQNALSENITKSGSLPESKTTLKTSDYSPRILYIVDKNTIHSHMSPALWWSYDPAKMDGC